MRPETVGILRKREMFRSSSFQDKKKRLSDHSDPVEIRIGPNEQRNEVTFLRCCCWQHGSVVDQAITNGCIAHVCARIHGPLLATTATYGDERVVFLAIDFRAYQVVENYWSQCQCLKKKRWMWTSANESVLPYA